MARLRGDGGESNDACSKIYQCFEIKCADIFFGKIPSNLNILFLFCRTYKNINIEHTLTAKITAFFRKSRLLIDDSDRTAQKQIKNN